MKMPVHMFISLGNILASQFKKEAEEQKKQQEDQMADMPNLRQFSDISSLANNLSNISSGNFQLPSMPNF